MQGSEWLEDYFEQVVREVAEGRPCRAPGAVINSRRLELLLDAAREASDGRRLLKAADFTGATFEGGISFDAVTFDGPAQFTEAHFREPVSFANAVFKGLAGFGGATFEKEARFVLATFWGESVFDRRSSKRAATFQGAAEFWNVTFQGAASFNEVAFEHNAEFHQAAFRDQATFAATLCRGAAFFGGATFHRTVDFDGIRIQGDASFVGTEFRGRTNFAGALFECDVLLDDELIDEDVATFSGDASFRGAQFQGLRDFGPVIVGGALDLDRSVFAQPVRIEVSAAMLSCRRARFREGADLLVRRAEVALDDADFGGPSIIAARSEPIRGEEAGPSLPRLISLRRAKVAKLTIAGVDVRACRFDGAHGLDQLRRGGAQFAQPPGGWHRSARLPLPVRWTRRQAIAEEHLWRTEVDGWPRPPWLSSDASRASTPAPPGQIAPVYRALRKGREDDKDEPGAADFYYGEMEMRRRAGSTPTGERAVLWLYWLVSGYGLRASRALAALVITVLAAGFLFDWFGFRPDRGLGRSLLFSIESSSSLFRAPEAHGFALTAGGEVLQVVLRLLAPLFLGLLLLSLRGRVKR